MVRTTIRMTLPLLAAAVLAGCNLLNYPLALIAPELPGPKVHAEYEGLEGRTVAVVVFAGMDVRYDYPTVREELAGAINRHLEDNVDDVRTIDAKQVVRYQDSHPRWRSEPLGDLGRALGADAVLYVSLTEFSMQERGSLSLPQGRVSGQLSVWDAQALSPGQDPCQWRKDSVSAQVQSEPGSFIDRRQLVYLTREMFAQTVVRYFHEYRLDNQEPQQQASEP